MRSRIVRVSHPPTESAQTVQSIIGFEESGRAPGQNGASDLQRAQPRCARDAAPNVLSGSVDGGDWAGRSEITYARIILLLPRDRVRAWVLNLADALRSCLPLPVEFHRLDDAMADPRSLPCETSERRLFGRSSLYYSNWISSSAVSASELTEWAGSLVISALERDPSDLPGDLRNATILAPVFEGDYCLSALSAALHTRKPLTLGVAVIAAARVRLVQVAQVAIPEHELTFRVVATVLAHAMLLLRSTCTRLVAKDEPIPPALPSWAAGHQKSSQVAAPRLHRVLHTYFPKVGRRLMLPFVRSEGWCIAYRRVEPGRNPPLDINLDDPDFVLIEPDHGRFFADPMLFRYKEFTVLFFEEFDYSRKRGRISFLILDDKGRCSEPVEALSRPYHLSYPFVFEHAGAPLMVPETSNNRSVELSEAT